jgi:hypothetical protein
VGVPGSLVGMELLFAHSPRPFADREPARRRYPLRLRLRPRWRFGLLPPSFAKWPRSCVRIQPRKRLMGFEPTTFCMAIQSAHVWLRRQLPANARFLAPFATGLVFDTSAIDGGLRTE